MSNRATEASDPTLELEHALRAEGHRYVIACDEVGRGALAGPVAVGMVVVDTAHESFPAGLRDSKLLSERRRDALLEPCQRWCAAWAVGMVEARRIDEEGIVASLGLAGARALATLDAEGLDIASAPVVLDGTVDYLSPQLTAPRAVITRAKADRDCASVAAASVIAKVRRDGLMAAAHEGHPHYEWLRNKGYGSQAHRRAITEHGPSELHRLTWIGKYLPSSQLHVDLP